MKTRRNIDTRKRKTLKTLGGLGAGAALTAVPAISAAASALGVDPSTLQSDDLEITLISSPDVLENSFIVKNTSQSSVSINNFHGNNVVFDGDIIDCNGSCANQALTLEPGQERVFYVSRVDSNFSDAASFEYLDAQPATSYLPHGTRIVNLGAKVSGNSGYLYTRPEPIAA